MFRTKQLRGETWNEWAQTASAIGRTRSDDLTAALRALQDIKSDDPHIREAQGLTLTLLINRTTEREAAKTDAPSP